MDVLFSVVVLLQIVLLYQINSAHRTLEVFRKDTIDSLSPEKELIGFCIAETDEDEVWED